MSASLFSLRGQVVLVTGATGGLGQAIAQVCAQQGAAAPVPFGGFAAGAEGAVVGAGAGQVEVELDARCRRAGALLQRQCVHVVGRRLCLDRKSVV